MGIASDRHPLLHSIASCAEWREEDHFPAFPQWADENERWLSFLDAKGELGRFLPRLKKSAYQRDRALSEIAIAYYLDQKRSLQIIGWEPTGNAGKKGEYLVRGPVGPIFVEVKTLWWNRVGIALASRNPNTLMPRFDVWVPGLSSEMQSRTHIQNLRAPSHRFSSSETTISSR
jgi:hypothetical protein